VSSNQSVDELLDDNQYINTPDFLADCSPDFHPNDAPEAEKLAWLSSENHQGVYGLVKNIGCHNGSTATARFSSEQWRYLANLWGIESS
jgi:hypothetical protein